MAVGTGSPFLRDRLASTKAQGPDTCVWPKMTRQSVQIFDSSKSPERTPLGFRYAVAQVPQADTLVVFEAVQLCQSRSILHYSLFTISLSVYGIQSCVRLTRNPEE